MQAGTTIELDAMETAPPPGNARRAPAATPNRRPAPGPVSRTAADDEEVLLDDSDDEFDDATIDDASTVQSANFVPAARTPAARPTNAMAPPAVPPSINESTTSLATTHSNGSATRSTSIFSRLMKKKSVRNNLGDSSFSSQASGADAGRLRRYSANADENAPISVPNTSTGGASMYNARSAGAPAGGPAGAPAGASGVPPSAPGTPRSGARRNGNKPSSAAPPRPQAGVKRFRVTGATPRSVQALIFYLYTSQAHFVSTPHQSPHSDATSLHEEANELLGDGSKQSPSLWPPTFSSKAAYCLGHQLELRDLSMRAFDHLTLNLSPRTVLADLLSPFGDRFAEVQRAQLDFITMHWEEVKTRPDFAPTIENLVHGEYPNSSKSLFHLFSKLSIRSY